MSVLWSVSLSFDPSVLLSGCLRPACLFVDVIDTLGHGNAEASQHKT